MKNLYNEDIKNGLQLVLGRTLDGCSTLSNSSNPYIGSKFSIKELECIDSLKSSNWLLDDSKLNYIEIDDKTKKRIKRKALIIFIYKKFFKKRINI